MLSDEEKEALRNFKSEYETCDHYSSDLIIELDDAEIILKLIEKQSKEIEELNLKNEKLYEDNLTLAQEIKEFIEGTNDVKYYSTSFIKNHYISKDKIKAILEEYLEYDKRYKRYLKDGRECFTMEYYYAKMLESLLKKE